MYNRFDTYNLTKSPTQIRICSLLFAGGFFLLGTAHHTAVVLLSLVVIAAGSVSLPATLALLTNQVRVLVFFDGPESSRMHLCRHMFTDLSDEPTLHHSYRCPRPRRGP